MKIGILGGSFDPIHKGHLRLARESVRQFQLDKILFVPAFLSPHKTEDPPITPAPVRARMVELAITGEERWELCDLELGREGISYTVDTLRELRKIYPSPHELFFIAGADSFHDLDRWKEHKELMKLCEWVIAPRSSVKLPEKLPVRFHLLKMPIVAVSASELRGKIGRGEDVSAWIPEQVQNYIRRMRLYQEMQS